MMNEAFLIALGALLPALAAAVGAILMALRKYQQDKRDAVLVEWKQVVDRQAEQMARQERLSEEHQRIIAELHTNEARCQAELGEVFVWLRHFREGWINALKRLGEDVSSVPPVPERRTSLDRADFLRRTSEQDAALIKQIGQQQQQQTAAVVGIQQALNPGTVPVVLPPAPPTGTAPSSSVTSTLPPIHQPNTKDPVPPLPGPLSNEGPR